MALAGRLMYLIQNFNHPNVITIIYALSAVIGGCMLGLGKPYVYLGLLIFYFKGTLDFVDGHLARLKGKTSLLGEKLDAWAGRVGTISFYVGVGLYIGNYGVLWVFMMCGLLKLCKVKIGRTYVIDIIIFSVGLHLLLT